MNYRAMLDFGMAILWIGFGCFLMFSRQILGYDYFEGVPIMKDSLKYIWGGVFCAYGLFRVYRGWLILKQGPASDED